MSSLSLAWKGDQRYIGTDSWGNEVSIDGTQGSGIGAKPSDLVPLSLAACTAYTLIEILQKQRRTIESVSVDIEVEHEDEAPWMFRSIDISFRVRSDADQAKAEKALALAHEKYCSVAASLHPDVKTSYAVRVESA